MQTSFVTSLLLAVGYAALHGAVVAISEMSGVTAGSVPALPAVIPAALMSWLLLVGSGPSTLGWRLLLTGYLTIAVSVLMTIAAIVTVSIGYFDPGAMVRMTSGVLPRAIVIYGTGAAILTLLYGLTVRIMSARLGKFRKVLEWWALWRLRFRWLISQR